MIDIHNISRLWQIKSDFSLKITDEKQIVVLT